MSIDPTSCPSPAMATILLLWLCGVLAGGGLTVLSVRVCDQVQSSKDRKRQMEEATAMALRRQREEATLIQRKQEEEVLDELMDEHTDCAECHPWIHFLRCENLVSVVSTLNWRRRKRPVSNTLSFVILLR